MLPFMQNTQRTHKKAKVVTCYGQFESLFNIIYSDFHKLIAKDVIFVGCFMVVIVSSGRIMLDEC
jgi:hypothetical protein